MFVGHYGVALAGKRASLRLPLGLLFLAVQFLDVLFAAFVLCGIEKLRIVHGFTPYNPYDLYWMPYTHSFVGALFWSALVGWIWWMAARRVPRVSSCRSRTRGARTTICGCSYSNAALDRSAARSWGHVESSSMKIRSS